MGWREKGLTSRLGDSQKAMFMELLPWENRKQYFYLMLMFND